MKETKETEETKDKLLPCQGFDGPCKSRKAKLRRQNTKYVNDEMNWVIACDQCFEGIEEYWAERWAEYYSMIR